MAEVLCQFCKSQSNKVEKDKAVRIDNKNFHERCAQLYLDKKKLHETICRIFNLKQPGPRNNAYVSKFFNEGMTYKGMNSTLVYFYEIKKNDTKKAREGIGIIPYVYEEAREYFKMENKRKQENESRLEKIEVKTEQEIRYVRAQERQKPVYKFHNKEEFEW